MGRCRAADPGCVEPKGIEQRGGGTIPIRSLGAEYRKVGRGEIHVDHGPSRSQQSYVIDPDTFILGSLLQHADIQHLRIRLATDLLKKLAWGGNRRLDRGCPAFRRQSGAAYARDDKRKKKPHDNAARPDPGDKSSLATDPFTAPQDSIPACRHGKSPHFRHCPDGPMHQGSSRTTWHSAPAMLNGSLKLPSASLHIPSHSILAVGPHDRP